jgi:integrase
LTRVQVHGRLTALAVKHAKERGVYPDGQGLLLQISRNGSKSWILRFRIGGRRRYCGLGALPDVSLAQARERAAAARLMLDAGQDPIEVKKGRRAATALSAAKAMSFLRAATSYIAAHSAGWSVKTARDWTGSLTKHVYPVMGTIPVGDVDTGLVLQAIEPLWAKMPETANRIRNHIENVLDWAKARGYRSGENPARLKGHIDHLLPPKSKVIKVVHHPAIAYAEMPAFMERLRQEPSIAARALEFLILTAARSGEVLQATWDEINLADAMWIVPGARMKQGKEHRVPLSDAAVNLLQGLPTPHTGIIFQGIKPGQPINKMGMPLILKRMKRTDITAHGMRGCFRTWAAEQTDYPHEVCEAALAHAVGNQVSRAYQHSDVYERRVKLMTEWSNFVDGKAKPSAEVVALRPVA